MGNECTGSKEKSCNGNSELPCIAIASDDRPRHANHVMRTTSCEPRHASHLRPRDRNSQTSTTLAYLFTPHLRADPPLAVRAALRWQSSDNLDDGVTHGWQAWLRRRSVDSFFPAALF